MKISSLYFRCFVITSNLVKRYPSFEQMWIPFTQGCFVHSLVEIGSVVLEKRMKMWNVYRRTSDDRRSEKDHLSFQPRWTKKHLQVKYRFLKPRCWHRFLHNKRYQIKFIVNKAMLSMPTKKWWLWYLVRLITTLVIPMLMLYIFNW